MATGNRSAALSSRQTFGDDELSSQRSGVVSASTPGMIPNTVLNHRVARARSAKMGCENGRFHV
jgi:hypothetical protein